MGREVRPSSGELVIVNGRPRPVERCSDCGKPVHPSLECTCSGAGR